MLLRQLAEGRCEVENQYTRVVRPRRQPARARGDRRDDGAARDVRVARPRLDRAERAAPAARVRRLGRRGAVRAARRRGSRTRRRASAARCCIGAIKPWECGVFGTACTPERPLGTCMVSSEGACAAYYNYGATGAATRARAARRGPAGRSSATSVDHARPRRGRQGDARARRGRSSSRSSATRCSTRSATRPSSSSGRRAPRLHDRLLRRQAALLPRRRHRRARGQRHRQRPRGRGRAAARGSRPASSSRRASRSPTCAAIVALDGARPRQRPACPSSTGDTKVVERGKADGALRHDRRRRASLADGRRARPGARPARRPRARLRHARRPRHGRDDRPRRPRARGRDRERHRRRCTSWRQRCSTLGDALRWMRDPTRGGLATALNELAAAGGARGARSTRPRSRCDRRWSGACEILGIDPLYVANEGKLVAVVAAEAADAALAALRGASARRRTPRSSARSRAEPAGHRPPRHRASAAAASSTCSSAIRCRGSVSSRFDCCSARAHDPFFRADPHRHAVVRARIWFQLQPIARAAAAGSRRRGPAWTHVIALDLMGPSRRRYGRGP